MDTHTDYKVDSNRLRTVLENLSFVALGEPSVYSHDFERYKGKLAKLVPLAMEVELCEDTLRAETDGVIALPEILRDHLKQRKKKCSHTLEQTFQGIRQTR